MIRQLATGALDSTQTPRNFNYCSIEKTYFHFVVSIFTAFHVEEFISSDCKSLNLCLDIFVFSVTSSARRATSLFDASGCFVNEESPDADDLHNCFYLICT